MKTNQFTPVLATFAALFLIVTGCSAPAKTETTTAEAAKPDMAATKAEIQALENQYAAAYNARDLKAITALYTNDAVSMVDDAPMLMGKAAIQKDYEASFSKNPPGVTVSFDIVDVFGDENTVNRGGQNDTQRRGWKGSRVWQVYGYLGKTRRQVPLRPGHQQR